MVLLDFLLTVKAVPHECVIRTSQPKAKVKAEKEVWFIKKSNCIILCHHLSLYLVLKTPENKCI